MHAPIVRSAGASLASRRLLPSRSDELPASFSLSLSPFSFVFSSPSFWLSDAASESSEAALSFDEEDEDEESILEDEDTELEDGDADGDERGELFVADSVVTGAIRERSWMNSR